MLWAFQPATRLYLGEIWKDVEWKWSIKLEWLWKGYGKNRLELVMSCQDNVAELVRWKKVIFLGVADGWVNFLGKWYEDWTVGLASINCNKINLCVVLQGKPFGVEQGSTGLTIFLASSFLLRRGRCGISD